MAGGCVRFGLRAAPEELWVAVEPWGGCALPVGKRCWLQTDGHTPSLAGLSGGEPCATLRLEICGVCCYRRLRGIERGVRHAATQRSV